MGEVCSMKPKSSKRPKRSAVSAIEGIALYLINAATCHESEEFGYFDAAEAVLRND
jgi:hypothetical protein